jgi:PKD repeat protein
VLACFTTTPAIGAVPLTVSFSDASQGPVAQRIWTFANGVTLTNVLNPTQAFTNEGTYTVTLTAISDQGATHHASQTISAVANYRIQPAAFQWLDAGLMFPLALNSNGVSSAITLPFPFHFYGKCYSQISVGDNGVISFGSQVLPLVSRTDLPDTNAPASILCPFWTDRTAVAANGVWMTVRGKAPSRRVVISWSVPAGGGAGGLEYQAALFESSQRILFQYRSPVDGPLNLVTSQGATVGVGHESGLVAAKYSASGANSLTNLQAMVFVPSTMTGVTNHPSASVTTLLLSTEGQFQFQLRGQPASTYVIETSTDLKQWVSASSGTTSIEGSIAFADSESVAIPKRFYRARFEP